MIELIYGAIIGAGWGYLLGRAIKTEAKQPAPPTKPARPLRLPDARIICRPNESGNTVIIGFNTGLFRPGIIYEITEIMGEFMVKEIGPPANVQTFNYALGDIVAMGKLPDLLFTEEDVQVIQPDLSAWQPST